MWDVLVAAGRNWLNHKAARLGAALAYYSVFSLGPLLLIVVSVAGLFFGRESVSAALSMQMRELLGSAGSQAAQALLEGAGSDAGGAFAAVFGVILLLIAALGVVVQLKDALNTIWETKEPEHSGLWAYLRTYLVSFAGILSLGFLLAVSLVISTALSAISGWLGGSESVLWEILNFTVSLAVLSLLFAMLFRWFPDADVAWRDALAGGVVTALLFNVGKTAISWYIGTQGLESTYGAAASLVVLLVWIYYAAQILLYGAEVTHVLHAQNARRHATEQLRHALSAAGRRREQERLIAWRRCKLATFGDAPWKTSKSCSKTRCAMSITPRRRSSRTCPRWQERPARRS